jgi:hypothetical protein
MMQCVRNVFQGGSSKGTTAKEKKSIPFRVFDPKILQVKGTPRTLMSPRVATVQGKVQFLGGRFKSLNLEQPQK